MSQVIARRGNGSLPEIAAYGMDRRLPIRKGANSMSMKEQTRQDSRQDSNQKSVPPGARRWQQAAPWWLLLLTGFA
jgi:hypothetical protein